MLKVVCKLSLSLNGVMKRINVYVQSLKIFRQEIETDTERERERERERESCL